MIMLSRECSEWPKVKKISVCRSNNHLPSNTLVESVKHYVCPNCGHVTVLYPEKEKIH